MKIVQITTDSRVHYGDYSKEKPYFGTAPAGLLDGFSRFPELEVHVISCSTVALPQVEKLAPNIYFHQPIVSKLGWGKTFYSGCIKAVRNITKEIQPDIVHGQGTERECAMAAVHSGFPNVLTIHGNMRVHASRGEHSKSLFYKIAALLETHCLKRTNGVVAISRYTDDLVKPLTAKTWLLPNAAASSFFETERNPSEPPRVLFVGTICERKNPIGLIRACKPLLKSGKCTIVFSGQVSETDEYGSQFLKLVRETPGLTMLGLLDHEQIRQEFSKATILALPTFEDNCPMVVLEAMAAGVPVVASRVGGVPDLIQHDYNGLMFDPNHPQEIHDAIAKLLDNNDLRNTLATNGKHTALTQFHPKVIAEKHIEIYREVLAAR